MAQQLTNQQLSVSILPKTKLNKDEKNIWNIDFQKAILHECAEPNRFLQVAEIQTKAGTKNEYMPAGSSKWNCNSQPFRNISSRNENLEQMHYNHGRYWYTPQKGYFTIFSIAAFNCHLFLPLYPFILLCWLCIIIEISTFVHNCIIVSGAAQITNLFQSRWNTVSFPFHFLFSHNEYDII